MVNLIECIFIFVSVVNTYKSFLVVLTGFPFNMIFKRAQFSRFSRRTITPKTASSVGNDRYLCLLSPWCPLDVHLITLFSASKIVIIKLLGVIRITTVLIFRFGTKVSSWFVLVFIIFGINMSKFVSLMRLGITRGWRIRVLNGSKLYAVSIMHCLFIYLLLRAKSWRRGLWVVSYYIYSLLKKYVIHVFFWRLSAVKRHRIFELNFTVRVKYGRKIFASRSGPMRLWVGPTESSAASLAVPVKFRDKRYSLVSSWRRGNAILNRWWYGLNHDGSTGFYSQASSLGLSGFTKHDYFVSKYKHAIAV